MSDLNSRSDRSSLVDMTADLAQRFHNKVEEELDRLHRRERVTEVDARKMVLAALDVVRILCASACAEDDPDYEKETKPLMRDAGARVVQDAESARRERKDDSKNFPTAQMTEKDLRRRPTASLSEDDISVPPPAYGMTTPGSIRKGPKRR